jgi:hypothetical protein
VKIKKSKVNIVVKETVLSDQEKKVDKLRFKDNSGHTLSSTPIDPA